MPLKHVKPDSNQPHQVDTKSPDFRDLVASLGEHGVIQPITVRYVEGDDYFQIVAGERRYRAALAAGLEEIPAVVKDLDDTNTAIQQIEENLHRANLNPIEEAAAIRRLMSAKEYTQRQVASKIHKPESYVSQLLAVEERLTRQEKTAITKLRPDTRPRNSADDPVWKAGRQENHRRRGPGLYRREETPSWRTSKIEDRSDRRRRRRRRRRRQISEESSRC